VRLKELRDSDAGLLLHDTSRIPHASSILWSCHSRASIHVLACDPSAFRGRGVPDLRYTSLRQHFIFPRSRATDELFTQRWSHSVDTTLPFLSRGAGS
jgi:hypothetical protein